MISRVSGSNAIQCTFWPIQRISIAFCHIAQLVVSVCTQSVLPAGSLSAHDQKWSCPSKKVTTIVSVHNYSCVVVCCHLRPSNTDAFKAEKALIDAKGTLQRPYETPPGILLLIFSWIILNRQICDNLL